MKKTFNKIVRKYNSLSKKKDPWSIFVFTVIGAVLMFLLGMVILAPFLLTEGWLK